MLAAFDSNVLVYSRLEPDGAKGSRSIDLLERAGFVGGVFPVQVLGEFLWVVRRRRLDLYPFAVRTLESLPPTIQTPASTREAMAEAAILVGRYGLQFWDALICVAAAMAAATHLLSEDMQDGFTVAGLTIVNPFAEANRNLLDRLLPPLPTASG